MTATATKPRASAPPCVRCGTTEGTRPCGQPVPARISLVRFGINGKGCKRCYNELDRESARSPYKPPLEWAAHVGLSEPDRQAMAEARRWLLLQTPLPVPILDPWFSYEQLTPRAKTRLEIREAKKGGRL